MTPGLKSDYKLNMLQTALLGPVYRFILPLGSLPPGGEDTRGQLAPRGGKISRGIFTPTLGILPPTVFKIKFVFFDTNFNDK